MRRDQEHTRFDAACAQLAGVKKSQVRFVDVVAHPEFVITDGYPACIRLE